MYNRGDTILIVNELGLDLLLKVTGKEGESDRSVSSSYTYTIQNNGAYVKTLTVNGDGDYIQIIDQYSLTYDLNGGSGTAPTHTKSCGALDANKTITLASGSGLTKSGYVFAGWSTDSEATTGNTGEYTIQSKDIKNNEITLYAIWEEQQGGSTPSTGIYFDNSTWIITASVALVAGIVGLAVTMRKNSKNS